MQENRAFIPKLELRLLTGKIIQIPQNHLFSILIHRRFVAFAFFCIVVESSISPFAETGDERWLYWLVYRLIISLLFLVLYVSLVTCLAGCAHTFSYRYVWEPFLMIPALLVTALAAEPLSMRISGFKLLSTDQFFLNFVMMLVVLEIFIILYGHFVHPSIVEECIRHPAAAHLPATQTETQDGMWIVVNGCRYSIQQLQYIVSMEHYVNLVSQRESKLLRGRISDIAEQINGPQGMLVHRSYWVPLHAIRSVRKGKTMMTLVLKDATEVPVSRSRRNDVLNWLRENGRMV